MKKKTTKAAPKRGVVLQSVVGRLVVLQSEFRKRGNMSNRIDHGGNCALRKIGNPEGWTIYAWESLDDGSVLYRMALERPPGADGCRKWNTEQGKAVAVSQAEVSAEYARYEAETGKCGECGGHGERWVGWNRDTGHKYATCGKCGGSGNTPNKEGQHRE